MSTTPNPKRSRILAPALLDAWEDFLLSRQAMQCAPATLAWYKNTARRFLEWTGQVRVTSPSQIKSKHVREYLADLAGRVSDVTCHDHARAIRTLLLFLHREGYMPEAVKVQMPKVARKRLPMLTPEELERVIAACENKRDKAIVIFLADTGLRRAEAIALNWNDIDFKTGLVRVKRGKGGKARSAVISPTGRRALLAYRRTLTNPDPGSPLFLSRTGRHFTSMGFTLLFRRLTKQTGINVTAHALRRTFVILSLRAGMDVLHLQALLGHSTLSMVQLYAQMDDTDLLQSHRAHSPIENLARLKGGDKDT